MCFWGTWLINAIKIKPAKWNDLTIKLDDLFTI